MTTILISIAVAIAVFFLLRQVMLWYYRINDIVQQQEKQTELLEQIKNALVLKQAPAQQIEKPSAKVIATTNGLYTMPDGTEYKVVSEPSDTLKTAVYFIYQNKKYYYTNLQSAEDSLTAISAGKEPLKENLFKVSNA